MFVPEGPRLRHHGRLAVRLTVGLSSKQSVFTCLIIGSLRYFGAILLAKFQATRCLKFDFLAKLFDEMSLCGHIRCLMCLLFFFVV